MRLLLEFITIAVVAGLVSLLLRKFIVDEFWVIGVAVAAGVIAGRLVNPNSYKGKDT